MSPVPCTPDISAPTVSVTPTVSPTISPTVSQTDSSTSDGKVDSVDDGDVDVDGKPVYEQLSAPAFKQMSTRVYLKKHPHTHH